MLKPIIHIVGLLGLALASLMQTAAAEEVLLRSKHSGKYVAVSSGMLAASAGSADRALKLDMVRLQGNNVAFRVPSSNTYVRAGVGSGTFLATGSPHIRGWETFSLLSLGGNTHALRSAQNGKLVRAGVGQGSFLAAVSDGKPRGWELFDIVPAAAAPSQVGGGSAVSSAVAGAWRLVSVAAHQSGYLVDLGAELAGASRIDIAPDGRLRATVGCNAITATVAQSGGNWRSSQPVSTKKACPGQGVMAAERSLSEALGSASRITMNDRTVRLKDEAGRVLLVMRKL